MKRIGVVVYHPGMTVASGVVILVVFCLMLSVWQKPPAIGG
jgi:hypothetical protein